MSFLSQAYRILAYSGFHIFNPKSRGKYESDGDALGVSVVQTLSGDFGKVLAVDILCE